MKNTIKMSLVAALAVAGLSTTASAGGLEDAIKGVSISGKMEVEYDYTNDNTDTSANSWDLDWDVTAKIPVNDMVTAVFGAEGDTATDVQTQTINTDKGADNLQVTKVYFQYSNGPVTAMIGKQGMAGAPWFDDERANGIVAMYNAGPVVVAAAHFNNINATNVNQTSGVNLSTEDIAAAAVIAGNIADTGINASLWYADVSDTLDSWSLNINGKVADMVNFDFRHTDVDLGDTVAGADASLTKIVLSADFGAVNARIGYGKTGDDASGLGGLVNLEGTATGADNDAATTYGLEQLNIADYNDADVFHIGAGTTFGATSVNVDYIDGEAGNANFDEILLQVDYAMSKNFNIGAHYSIADVDGWADDSTDAAISLEYKF